MSARLPASMQSTAGSQPGLLLDLSVAGARFGLADPETHLQALQVGRDVMLKWGRFEAMATIRWAARGAFGLQFDPSIAPQILIATREQDDAHALSLATRLS